nr:DNA-protecting protein DprA [Candidatus Levybacteria bacterium]
MERDYYLAFSLINGIGPKTFILILRHFKTAEKAWFASAADLKQAGLSERSIQKLEKARSELDIESYLEKLKYKKASFIALCDKEYPKLLKEIENPPIVLYVKGDISKVNLEKTIAVVGTRKITNYGSVVTKLFSEELAMSGFTVVSGLAMGVDAVASSSAIEAGGKTIAVLGNGVDLCFPSSNEQLYDKILENNGIIVSEFPLGQSPTQGSFPSRNRIIAGLSLGVLVTEGAADSGSLITADYAFKFKRKVFAIPGPITSSLSKAPLKLIERGAKLVVDAEDILKEFKIQKSKLKSTIQNSKFGNLTKEEKKIIDLLENEALHFDEIVRKLKMDSSKAGILLSMMEIKGIIKNSGGNYSLHSKIIV